MYYNNSIVIIHYWSMLLLLLYIAIKNAKREDALVLMRQCHRHPSVEAEGSIPGHHPLLTPKLSHPKNFGISTLTEPNYVLLLHSPHPPLQSQLEPSPPSTAGRQQQVVSRCHIPCPQTPNNHSSQLSQRDRLKWMSDRKRYHSAEATIPLRMQSIVPDRLQAFACCPSRISPVFLCTLACSLPSLLAVSLQNAQLSCRSPALLLQLFDHC